MATASAQVLNASTQNRRERDSSFSPPVNMLSDVDDDTITGERLARRQHLDEIRIAEETDNTTYDETTNALNTSSALFFGSTASAEHRTSYSPLVNLPSLSGEIPVYRRVDDIRNDAENEFLRTLPTLPRFARASELEWMNFENHFNANLWSQWRATQDRGYHPHHFNYVPPIRTKAGEPSSSRPVISARDLKAEDCNFQGLSWRKLGTTSANVREARRKTYIHRTNRMSNTYRSPPYNEPGGPFRVRRYMDSNGMAWAKDIPQCDNHFRFRRMFLRHRPHLAHFQLRNMMSANSRNAVFYAADSKVHCLNPQTGMREVTMDMGVWGCPSDDRGTITTVTAHDDVLIAGGWDGDYAIKSLFSEPGDTCTTGSLVHAPNTSINHIHVFADRRSGRTQAAISSNDCHVRILDCSVNTIIRSHTLPNAVNCSVTSPDGRLRLLVGDRTEPWILDAETGKLLVRLPNHKDFGFACDWAQDGVHIATGHQDGIVQIWDSRNWSQPLQILSTELSGIRTMQFSPLGSGKRVLAMAEPADLVSIVDAETFMSKQRFEFLGEIGGLSFTPDGQNLYVGNTDLLYGGILEFERAGDGEKYGIAKPDPMGAVGWSADADPLDDGLLLHSSRSRKRRGVELGCVSI